MGTLFVDKYRPRTLDTLDYHFDISDRLSALASSDFPHTLFYGPSGAGKKTRIMATLRELYGPNVEKIRVEQRLITTKTKKKLEINVIQSNYHIELTPSDAGSQDIHIVQEVLKDIAQTQQVDLNAKKKFKVVIINEADMLSRDAQSALRRTMEKFTGNLRVILCANSTSRIMSPIRSRCLLIRVGAPTDEQVATILQKVAGSENFKLPDVVASNIASTTDGNLRLALLTLETLHSQDASFTSVSSNPIGSDKGIPRPDWETYAWKVAEKILGEQTPERLLDVRGMLYELLVHCIPPSVILKTIALQLTERLESEEMKMEAVHWAAYYEHRVKQGTKPIFHLEAFCAKFMSVYKNQQLGFNTSS